MTREVQRSKDFFRLNGGLNSEINELTFPDGFTTDEANYELLVDGSRRRRKGLAAEASQGTARSVSAWTTSEFNQSYLWRDAGGDPDTDLMVFRKGDTLYFADADEIVSDNYYNQTVTLEAYETDDATTALTDDLAVTFSHGRGYLFVSGPYIRPIYIAYDGVTSFTATQINLRIRDFADIEDGENYAKEPTGTITADHRYNLRNRGWQQDDMDTYFSDKSKHPAKNSIWYRGYKRTYGASIYERDGQRSWDSNKLEAEAFGSSSAPRGSLFLEPFDTTFGYGIAGVGTGTHEVTTWSFNDLGATWDVTVTTATAHGIAVGEDFLWEGHNSIFNVEYEPGYPEPISFNWNFKHTAITGTTGSTLVFNVAQPLGYGQFDSWNDQFNQLGTIDGSLSLDRSLGTDHGDSMSAIEFHAGRVFYGGMRNSEFADTIFFSQICDSEEKFGRCYQEADPTDEHFNAITAADGGTIIIPGMSGVQNLIKSRDSILVIGKEGVWEISGGRRGVFTADGYSVRKLSDQGGNSPTGVISVENAVIYTGPGGIFIVQPNEFTGQLEVQSASETTIQTIWNQIPDAEQTRVQVTYDSSLRRMYFMYGPDGTGVGIDSMLIFDARAGAWFKYTFDTPADNELLTGFAIPNADDTSDNKKMKFIYKASSTTFNVADFDQTDFDDWDGTNGPLPYMVFGHDMMGEAQRRGQAPLITVFSKRTETGYTDPVAIQGDGTGYFTLGDVYDVDTSSAMTLEFKIKRKESASTGVTIAEKYGAKGWRLAMNETNGTISLTLNADSLSATVTIVETLAVNSWHHVSVVLDGANGTAVVYVDGTAVINATFSGTLAGATDFTLLARNGGTSPINADLDEVKVWTTARTEAQVQAGLDRPRYGDETGLVLYWPVNGTDATAITTVKDLIGNHTIAPTGSTLNYTAIGGFQGVNQSSTRMRANWDWTDDAISNKQGAQQEVYRHVRQFVPASASDVDGYPVVVTRNKVRGRGRALQLRFDGATDKDSHVLGFTTNYKITRKK